MTQPLYEQYMVKCPVCDKSFPSVRGRNTHMTTKDHRPPAPRLLDRANDLMGKAGEDMNTLLGVGSSGNDIDALQLNIAWHRIRNLETLIHALYERELYRKMECDHPQGMVGGTILTCPSCGVEYDTKEDR